MSEPQPNAADGPYRQGVDLGLYKSRQAHPPAITRTELIAAGLSVAWVVLVGGLLLLGGTGEDGASLDSLRFVMTVMVVFLPVALIWVAATAARSARIMRDESTRLQTAVDALRHSYVQAMQSGGSSIKPSVERKLEEIAAAQRKTEQALITFTSVRSEIQAQIRAEAPAVVTQSALPADAPPEEQPRLALGPSTEEPAPVSTADFIRALNFPENAEDREGFRALRRALQDRQTAHLVQASQDVLTMLSQDGIYMDDLTPDRAKPDVWRRFAQGERGKSVAGLGGIRDRSCLALAAGRMRQDPIFRDASHHFLRRFDRTLAAFEPNATDAEIAALADTRTARAFMLLGRVTGTFA